MKTLPTNQFKLTESDLYQCHEDWRALIFWKKNLVVENTNKHANNRKWSACIRFFCKYANPVEKKLNTQFYCKGFEAHDLKIVYLKTENRTDTIIAR